MRISEYMKAASDYVASHGDTVAEKFFSEYFIARIEKGIVDSVDIGLRSVNLYKEFSTRLDK